MKEVSKEEFYRVIGPQDAIDTLRVVYGFGRKAYAHTFMLRDSKKVLGEIIPKDELDRYPYFVKHYYIY